MTSLPQEIIHIKQGKSFVEIHIQGLDQRILRLRLTSSLAGVWRLQGSLEDIPYDNKGVVQMLAEITEERKDYCQSSQLDLLVKQRPSSSVITASGSDAAIEMFLSPFRLVFLDGGNHTHLEISEISMLADSLKVKSLLKPEERIYGTGERFNGVNQRGKKVNIWAEDRWCQTEGNSYLPIPFIISTRKYAFLANRFESATFDLGESDKKFWALTQNNSQLDVYIFLADNPREIYQKLGLLWGFPVMPPEWGFGVLVSRHEATKEFSTIKGIREMVSKMKKYELPWSGVIIEGWDTYNSDTYKELKTIVQELHKTGKKVLVYDACGRLPEKYWKQQKAQPEFFVRDKKGKQAIKEAPHYNPQDAPDRRRSFFIDITNPEVLEWWPDQVWKRLLKDIGIDGAKIDFCEQFPEDENIVLFSRRSLKGMHHFYPVKYNIMMYKIFQKYCTNGGLCWSRGGSIGAHKYPFVWCGDQLREFHFLKAILSALLSSGISGIPFMGHDLAGYLPAQNNDNEADVFVRGVQLSCFSAAMSTHGAVTRPYDFHPKIVNLYRLYSKIRYLLLPYIKEQAGISSTTGMPLLRHLFLHYPNEENVWDCEDEYLFGEDILVAPILDNSKMRDIILPPGKWIDLFNKKEYSGPQKIDRFPAPLERIPVFIRLHPQSTILPPLIEEIRTLIKADH
ncbi:alpha-xylosidase [archaeon]|nr:alpha-xylosidase [archaeon]